MILQRKKRSEKPSETYLATVKERKGPRMTCSRWLSFGSLHKSIKALLKLKEKKIKIKQEEACELIREGREGEYTSKH